jgi:hypothetical protein
MKIAQRVLVYSFVLVLALLVWRPDFFRRVLFKTAILESAQFIMASVALPNDYFKPILDEQLDFGKDDGQIEYKLKVRYVGDKYIRVALNRNEKLTEKILGGSGYVPDFVFQLKIYDGEKLLWQSETNNKLGPYLDGDEIGFNISEFNCTRDVPLNSDLRLVIKLIKHDKVFERDNLIRLKVINSFKD